MNMLKSLKLNMKPIVEYNFKGLIVSFLEVRHSKL